MRFCRGRGRKCRKVAELPEPPGRARPGPVERAHAVVSSDGSRSRVRDGRAYADALTSSPKDTEWRRSRNPSCRFRGGKPLTTLCRWSTVLSRVSATSRTQPDGRRGSTVRSSCSRDERDTLFGYHQLLAVHEVGTTCATPAPWIRWARPWRPKPHRGQVFLLAIS